MIDYVQILSRKYFGSQWELLGSEYDGLTWKSETKKPTKKELDDLWDEVAAEIESEKAEKIAKRQELLDRLGITADEAKLLLG
jgi:hypothetical protein